MSQSVQGALAPIVSPQSFAFDDHPVRVIMRDGEPWFVASDVAAALNYSDAEHATRHLGDHQKADTPIRGVSSNGTEQTRAITIINESGLYRLVLRSRKPEALKFSDWVTGEVLPSIRKTGSYGQQKTIPAALPPVLLHGLVRKAEMTIYVDAIGRGATQAVTIPVECLPFKPGDLVTLAYAPGTNPLIPNEMYRPLRGIQKRNPAEFAELLGENTK
jgi:prophage antirepressor-like protein